jgi:aryl-alcohol dehydrogenase-like predicted oxidoreductase
MIAKRRIGALEVGAIGLGSIAIIGYYGAADEAEGIRVVEEALDRGVSLIDMSDNYGPHTAEILVGKVARGRRDEVVLSTKGGNRIVDWETYETHPRGDPRYLREAIEGSLERLGTLEKVNAIHPISAVQSELSLWTRGPIDDVLPWCEEHGAGFVPFAPLGRGFLTGTIKSYEDVQRDGDLRAHNPRFQIETIDANQAILEGVRRVADRHAAAPAQVALAWLLGRSESIVPIPGMEKLSFLDENLGALELQLDDRDRAELDGLPAASGSRY